MLLLIVTPTILYAPMNFASASCFAHMKIDYVLKMAAVFQLVGCWIRPLSFLGPDYFWLLTTGTFVFFISNPLVLNAITTIANLWFSDDDRAKATAIAGLMAPLGSLLGLGLTGAISTGLEEHPDQDVCMEKFEIILWI